MLVQGDGRRLTERGYEQLRQSCRTHREELVVRLCGEAGLRAGEIARLRPSDVSGRGGQGTMRYFVTIREADGDTRTGYLPAGVAHDFWQYVRSNPINADDEVIDVTERRVQMLVREVCERAAAESGRAGLEAITPSTLRQFFAQQLLVEHGVDARVVAAVGGWEGVDAVLEPLPQPAKDEIGTTFERLASGQNESSRLPGVIETLEQIVADLTGTSTRGEIERLVCDRLVEQRYRAAWILTRDRQRDRLVARTHAGEDEDRFTGAASTGIVRRALQTGQSFVAPDDPGPASEQEGHGLLAAIPVRCGDAQYGALVVRASEAAFDEPERTALTMLGRQIGFAITAVERKQVLTGGAVLEVRFQYGDTATLVELASELDCDISLDGAVAGDDGFLCFTRIRDAPAKEALEAAAEIGGIDNARLIRSDDDGGLLEIALASQSPLLFLTERGGTVTELRISQGRATLTCELSPEADLRAIHDELRKQFPTLELRSKQERQSTTDPSHVRESLETQLTEKQRGVLRTAYHAGYFEWPRGSTAEDLAETMDISSPTLHNHLRKAQQNLLESILENE